MLQFASDLGLHCLPNSTLQYIRHKLVKDYSELSLQQQHLFPKNIAIKMNLLLYRIFNEQINM